MNVVLATWRALRRTACVIGVLMMTCQTTAAGQYDDPRVAEWSQLFFEGSPAATLYAIEKDLRGENPHPLATVAWVEMHYDADALDAAIEKLPNRQRAIREALGPLPRIQQLCNRRQYDVLFREFPTADAIPTGDSWALSYLANCADETSRHSLELDLLIAAIAQAPDVYQFVWQLADDTTASTAARQRLEAALDDQVIPPATPAARYLRTYLATQPWDTLDAQAAAREFIDSAGTDPRALTHLAFSAKALNRFDAAFDLSMQAIRLFPFYSNWNLLVHAAARHNDPDAATAQARDLIQSIAIGYHGSRLTAQRRFAYWWGRALRIEGDRGTARTVLEPALASSPNDSRLLRAMAELEIDDDRPAQAMALARRAIAERPNWLPPRELLVEALEKDGDLRTALEAFEEARAAGLGRYDESFWHAGGKLMERLEQFEPRVALLEEAYAANPESSWMGRVLGHAKDQAGDSDAARARILAAIHQDPRNRWAITQYANLTTNSPDNLEQLAVAYPWQATAWSELAKRADGTSAKLAVWRAAAAQQPCRVGYVGEQIEVLTSARRWEDAMALARDVVVDDCRVSDRVAAQRLVATVVTERSRHESLDRDLINLALTALDAFDAAGGDLLASGRDRVQLLRAAGEIEAAAEAMRSVARVQPDDPNVFHDMIANFRRELHREGFAFGRRFLDRRPYSEDALSTFLHKHLLWGGSPVLALQAIHMANTRAVTSNPEFEGRAYGQLGDPVRQYEATYTSERSVGVSERYLGWYDDLRRRIREGESTSVRLVTDAAMPTVDLISEDGSTTRRVDHPVTGQTVRIERGAAFVQATYDRDGQRLRRLEDSSDRWLAFEYDNTDQITRLARSNGGTLDVEYDAQGQMTRLSLAGTGEVRILRNADGSVSEYNGVSEDPDVPDHHAALIISQTLQEATRRLSVMERAVERGEFPDADQSDEIRDRLVDAADTAPRDQRGAARLALAQHLLEHRGLSPEYAGQALELFSELADTQVESGAPTDTAARELAITAISGWNHLIRTTRPYGVSDSDFGRWASYRAWISRHASGTSMPDGLARNLATPPARLNADWLTHSPFSNPGYWRRMSISQVLPRHARDASRKAMLVRADGDVVLGTGRGFSVLRDGFWTWYGFDPATQRFSPDVAATAIDDRSNVLALAETSDGALWIGTADGLYSIDDAYTGIARAWRTSDDGLPGARVTALAATDAGELWVGTSTGLASLEGGVLAPISLAVSVNFLRFEGTTAEHPPVLLIGTDRGLYGYAQGEATVLHDQPVDDALIWSDPGQFLVLRGRNVETINWPADDEAPGAPQPLPDQQALAGVQRVYGLTRLTLEDGRVFPAVRTNLGLAVLRDWALDGMPVPLAHLRNGLRVGPTLASSTQSATWLTTNEGVYGFEPGRALHVMEGPVEAVLSQPEVNLTFVATGSAIHVVDQTDPAAGTQFFSELNATALALDGEGGLVANDGDDIYRFPKGSTRAQRLFSTEQSVEEDRYRGPFRDLTVTSDGTIWAVAGSSVFRHANGETQEFNWFLDAEQFPARSQMISRVVETVDGEIWVVASNESHLAHRGIQLSGGILRYTGSGFERLDEDRVFPSWFISGYTPIDDGTAIVATNAGFARHRAGRVQSYQHGLSDPSYARLADAVPQLWRGRQGAVIGDDTWLFPTAGGVVMLHRGTWMYPDRINQLLPGDARFGQYGARTVHALATDPGGNIYAANDHGLLVYRSGGTAGLLIDNAEAATAFSDRAVAQLRSQADVLMRRLPEDSDAGRLVGRIRSAGDELEALRGQLTLASATPVSSSASFSTQGTEARAIPPAPDASATELRKQIRKREEARARLMARLERDNYGMFQMLKLDPRALATLHQELKPEQAVVQYIPDRDALHVQVVTRDSTQLFSVNVTAAELDKRIVRARAALANQATALHAADRGGKRTTDQPGLRDAQGMQSAQLEDDLAWLYEKLLRPVRITLDGLSQVFLVPTGRLNYAPFAALISQPRTDSEPPRYAVADHAMGVLPSMFHLDQILRHQPSLESAGLVVGDPDGSLPGAREEAKAVQAILAKGTGSMIGAEATRTRFEAAAPDARVIHLATHGVLDHRQPEASYLLLANGERLDLIDIQLMDLRETDLVVLSACESALGQSGLELSTMAGAFALAKVPTIVASLWKVDDAATLKLMLAFHDRFEQRADSFAALASAQRSMIEAGGDLAKPAAWSGFVVFGKP